MRVVVVLFLIFGSLQAFAQQEYLTFDEVQFSSSLEKETLARVLNDEGDLIDGFLIISAEDSSEFAAWKKVYSRKIEELQQRKKPKKIAKDVKYLYDQLHQEFLTKYMYLAYFDEIFETGVYNCVTAVALYAMAFEACDIPYNIKETPTHVYIVADPDDSQLLIETTDPVDGFKTFRPGFKEQFVSQLGVLKLINENDIAKKGIYGVFDEFYFGGAVLSLKSLVGIQYYNKGISLYENNDYHGAWHAFSIAQLFHSNDQINKMLFASIASVVSYSDYSDWNDIELLPYLERFLDYDLKQTNIVGEFQKMINYVLIQNNDKETMKMAYEYFMEKSKNEELKKEISFNYYNELAIRSYNRANYDQSFGQFAEAYKAKPGHARVENMLLEAFKLAYRYKTPVEGLTRLDTLITNSPELLENNRVNSLRLNLYLEIMKNKFDSKQATKGNSYKALFEEAVAAHPDYRYDEHILGTAYSKAAVYYYKRGYTTKARSIIRTGLKYAPNNYELKSRLRMVSN